MVLSVAVKLSYKIIRSWWGSVRLTSQGNEFEICVTGGGISSNFGTSSVQNTSIVSELKSMFWEAHSQIWGGLFALFFFFLAQTLSKIPQFCGSEAKVSSQTGFGKNILIFVHRLSPKYLISVGDWPKWAHKSMFWEKYSQICVQNFHKNPPILWVKAQRELTNSHF